MPIKPDLTLLPQAFWQAGYHTIHIGKLLENWPREQAAMRLYRARYYAAISHLDYNVGRLRKHLQLLKQLENTIIVYIGD